PDVLKDNALAFSLPRDLLDRTATYRALDDLTVEWVGLPGYLDREYFTRFLTPMPKHKLAGRDPVEFLDDADTLPVGWGPYRLVRWQPGDQMILERNPFYFRVSEGLPRLDRVVFRFSGFEVIDVQGNVDYSSVVAAVAVGDCDIVSIDPGTNLPLDVWQARVPDVQAHRTPVGVEYLFFNLDRLAGDPRPDFFGDRRVRLAFAHCIDRVGLGVSAAALPADELPWTLSSDKAIVYAYDPDRGRALLAEAGWTDANGDGVADKGGVPFEVTLLTTTSPLRQEVAERIRNDMAACSVRINPEFLEPGKLFAEGPDSPLYGRQFDLAEFAWLSNDLSVCQTWRSDRIPSDTVGFAGSYQNYSGYRNPDFDAACLAYLHGVYEADRETAGQDLIALFAEDLPSLPLFWREWHTGARAGVIGFGLDPFAAELWNIEEIDVQP
ncbi:MAG TPA: ABC transporter substrate-binding protein, partial [Anaerolineae bacterium]|nr:ABC transporter substrate-binding protein [Anaerolineae bacterium]